LLAQSTLPGGIATAADISDWTVGNIGLFGTCGKNGEILCVDRGDE
jgi:hypothetical protein